MTDESTFILNIQDGADVMHRKAGLTERCNTDQIEGRQDIDDETATALAAIGTRLCEHCFPDGVFV